MVVVEKDLSLKFSGHRFFFVASLLFVYAWLTRQVSKLSMTVKLMTSH